MPIIGRPMSPERVHSDYARLREERSGSLILQEGVYALRRDAQGSPADTPPGRVPPLPQRRFIWPRTDTEDDRQPGQSFSPFEARIKGLRITNAYSEAVASIACLPFGGQAVVEGYPLAVEEAFNGLGSGVDGTGAGITEFYRVAFEQKLFGGAHYARMEVAGSVPLWVQLLADDLLDWDYQFIDGAVVLLGANIQTADDERVTYWTALDDDGTQGTAWQLWRYDPDARSENKWIEVRSGQSLTSGVPIVSFLTDWETPYTSPPPFLDAAFVQMEATRQRSYLDAFIAKVTAGDVFTVTEWSDGVDDEGNPKRLPVRGNSLVFTGAAKVEWVQMDGSNIAAVAADITESLMMVRTMCRDPLRQQAGGEVKALEVGLHAKRAESYLEALLASDVSSLQTMARMTAEALGLTVDQDAKIGLPVEFQSIHARSVLGDFERLALEGLISKPFFYAVAQLAMRREIPAALWEHHAGDVIEDDPLVKVAE